MDWFLTIASVIVGFVLRLGLPIAITILVIYTLRRLDERWQAEAKAETLPASVAARVDGQQCWELKGCSEENKAECPASTGEQPCWQVFRLPNGYLQEGCLTCEFFKKAPVPT